MRKVTLQEIVTKVDQLPQLPEAALRVTRMLEDPNTNAEQLANIIRLDPNMTTQILRLCNSAAYGFSRKISTVKEAVAILGLNTLKSLVYTIISKFALDRPVDGYSLKKGELWINALTCAVYAKFLSEHYRRIVDPELAFTGALLRDIGKIVLGEYVGESYREIEAMTMNSQIDFVEAEEQVIGFNHCMVGMKVAQKWNLPPQLLKVIRYHHRPSSMPPETTDDEVKLASVVHLADAFTMMIGTGLGGDGMMYCVDTEALERVGIDLQESSVDALMSRLVSLHDVVKDMADSLSAPAGA